MVKQNFDYFKENFEELYKQYKGKYIVLKNCEVIGVYSNLAQAARETAKTEELGTFAVQHCERDNPGANRFYNDNVKFGVV